MKENIAKERSFEFSILIVRLCRDLRRHHREYEISSQLIRSGTAIGALINESRFAESKKDFIHKLSIALKEANETAYWIKLLFATETIDKQLYQSLESKAEELIKLLVASTKTLKYN